MRQQTELTPARAVLVGHIQITLPSLAIMCGVGLSAFLLTRCLTFGKTADVVLVSNFVRLTLCELLGFVAAWWWWRRGVRQWRKWAKRNAVDAKKTETLAVRTFLVWPNRRFESGARKRGYK